MGLSNWCPRFITSSNAVSEIVAQSLQKRFRSGHFDLKDALRSGHSHTENTDVIFGEVKHISRHINPQSTGISEFS